MQIQGLTTRPESQSLLSYQHAILTGDDAQADMERVALASRTIMAQLGGTGIPGLDGKTIQLALHPEDVHISEELADYVAGYSPARYMADMAAPLVSNVPQLFNQYRVFTRANAFQQANVLASSQSAVNEVDPRTELKTYQCVDRALGGFVPAITEATDVKSFNVRQALLRRISWALGLDREIRIFGTGGLLSTSANFASANVITIAGADEWDTANGDPLVNINEAGQASAMPITDWFMSTPTMDAMIQNVAFRDHNRAIVGDRGIENLVTSGNMAGSRDFKLPGYEATFHEVPAKVLNEATGDLDYVLTDVCIGTRRMPSGQPNSGEDMVTAQTWRFTGLGGQNGMIIREFDRPERGLAGGRQMVSGHSEDVVIVADDVGAIIVNTLA